MEETEKFQRKLPNQEIDYFKLGKILLSRWYWIATSVGIAVVISYAYLWYTPKTYATSGTLKIEEKKSEVSDLITVMAVPERGPSKIQSITSVLQSRNVILSAIKDMDYRVSFYLSGRVRTTETYPSKPLNIQLIKFDSLNFFHEQISYRPIDRQTFSLSYKAGDKEIKNNYRYNSPVTIGNTSFNIKYPGAIDNSTIYLFNFNIPEDYIGRVQGGLRAGETGKNTNIISIQETDSNPQFAADVLNNIMKEYVIFDRNQKAQSASQMIDFIDSQLSFLSNEVKGSESSIEKYKNKNKILDVNSASATSASKAAEIESNRSLLKIQLISLDQLKDQITKEKDNVTLNFSAGGTDLPALNALINKLDGLISERSGLLKTFTPNSQPLQEVNQQILQTKLTALNNIKGIRSSIEKNMAYLDSQLSQVNQTIMALPAAQRDLVSLQRDFEINDKVYSFLSEKKLEAQISRAGILPGATVIEFAQPNFNAVSPNEHDIHRSAIIFGLAIGLGLIILIRVLNPYIYDKETIESLTAIPILGIIRKYPDIIDENSKQVLALSKPRSIFAESVRSVRTNLSFLASEKLSKVICITSEVAGEGKSFVAVNLSSTLSLIDKKVVLIGADLRRSKLHKTFHVPNDLGLSNYLAHQNEMEDIILHSDQQNLDFIVSGPVPPNPSELLHSDRMQALINQLKLKYDIVMIDTAPIGLVSDAIPLIRVSDINVFVIRSGKSKFYAASVPQRIAQEYHLDNTVIVLNAFEEDLLHSRYYTTKFSGDSAGARYYYYSDYSGYSGSGYYLEDDKNKWWDIRRWFK
ncbi:polysaccharide biosynthesis tyrosine autokinase [Mucilaginibacter sp. KACC 22773]|uniref:GumC family protein n=1 Tax=Mucilaginibacter sp. KACC 22773 TaxID=3025671 RepID=UPI002365E158|nr:tyrosine-protein kinase family protein [Mucilaginibacter sp. KACC 22773]WDF76881.1 polysaccharide biosynthesis tyrosine autokinase [Mucilaginibacter sp. KACC 22773]